MRYFIAILLVLSAFAFCEEETLDEKLEALRVPENTAPAGTSSEKLYVVQNRFNRLQYKGEVSVGGANNFNSDSFLSSRQLDLTARFYLSDRWFISASGSYPFNSFSSEAERLNQTDGIIPDVAYPRFRSDLMVGFQPFYGKFRITMDQVFHFDQYIALGAGLCDFELGTRFGPAADIGIAFWLGQSWSFRFGIKDVFVREQRRLGESYVHHLLGHLEVGYLFGGT